MLVRVSTAILSGLEPIRIQVEVNVTGRGFPSFDIVGMAGKSVQESKERVRSAIISSGYDFPQKKILVNLMPADLPKEGTSFDLPIAISILACLQKFQLPTNAVFYGELALNGDLNYTRGCFNLGLSLLQQFKSNTSANICELPDVFIPKKAAKVLMNLDGFAFFAVNTLTELVSHLCGKDKLMLNIGKSPKFKKELNNVSQESNIDISLIQGQARAKRALLVSMAGKHNILFIGSPGSGKTLLASSIPLLLPDLSYNESLQVTQIYSANGLLEENSGLVSKAPFRAPHHSSSIIGIIGGGNRFKIGEIGLAHKGVLFLDELPEFSSTVLECLRQPLEDKCIKLTKASYKVCIPTDFVLVATANPCHCGYYGDEKRECTCSLTQRLRYLHRISGPVLDRIDMIVPVHTAFGPFESNNSTHMSHLLKYVTPQNISDEALQFRKTVATVRSVQEDLKQAQCLSANGIAKNSITGNRCTLSSSNSQILQKACIKFNLSFRAKTKIILLSRTIADIELSSSIEEAHLLEAISYRTAYLKQLKVG